MYQQAQQTCGNAWNLLMTSTEGFSETSFWYCEDLSCLADWQGLCPLHIAGTSLRLHGTGKDSRKDRFGLCTVRSNHPPPLRIHGAPAPSMGVAYLKHPSNGRMQRVGQNGAADRVICLDQ